MSRIFIVDEKTKEEIMLFSNTWTNEFPRLITRVTRRTDGYNIIIEGTENDISEFINKLTDNGVTLNR